MPAGDREIVISGDQVYIDGRPMYTSPATAGVHRRLDSLQFGEDTLYILCSPLLGIGLREIQAKLPPSSILYSLELDSKIDAVLGKSYLPENIPYFTANDLAVLEHEVRMASKNGIRRVRFISLNGGYRLHSGRYSEIERLLLGVLRGEYQNRATELHLGRLWIKNSIANYPDAVDAPLSLPTHPGQARDIPAVIIGAGPSTEELLPLLELIAEKAVLIAVDTILPTLIAHNTPPDIVLVLESQFANLADFTPGIPEWTEYILDSSSYPGLVRLLPSQHIRWVHTRFAENSLMDRLYAAELPGFPPLGSVGPAAIYLAESLLSGPLLSAGIDFAYLTEKSHAAGSAPVISEHLRKHRLVSPLWYRHAAPRSQRIAEARDGSMVYTDMVLSRYQESTRATLGNSRCRTVGGTGLPIGLPVCRPEEFRQRIAAYPDLPPTGGKTRYQQVWNRIAPQQSAAESMPDGDTDGTDAKAAAVAGTEIARLKEAGKMVASGHILGPELDYITYGLPPNPHPAQIDIMIRYYIDRWEQLLYRCRPS
ncbi:MAG: 6-hydroxymethylpterin diphosphokinase MptE-like protein [Spirochaeta sp.]